MERKRDREKGSQTHQEERQGHSSESKRKQNKPGAVNIKIGDNRREKQIPDLAGGTKVLI